MTTTQRNVRPSGDRSPDRSLRPEDFLGLDVLLSEEELGVRDETLVFVEKRIKPNIKEW